MTAWHPGPSDVFAVLSHRYNFIRANDAEAVLHEFCHAATLNMQAHIYKYLESAVSSRIEAIAIDRDPLLADWQEVMTCAAEIRAAMLLGWDLGYLADYTGRCDLRRAARGVLANNVFAMSEEEAVDRIVGLVWAESSYRRARLAIDEARLTLIGVP